MDEHAEAGFTPPLHPGIALGGTLGVLNGGDRMANWLGIRLAALQLCMTQRSGDEKDNRDVARASQVQNGPSQRNDTACVRKAVLKMVTLCALSNAVGFEKSDTRP